MAIFSFVLETIDSFWNDSFFRVAFFDHSRYCLMSNVPNVCDTSLYIVKNFKKANNANTKSFRDTLPLHFLRKPILKNSQLSLDYQPLFPACFLAGVKNTKADCTLTLTKRSHFYRFIVENKIIELSPTCHRECLRWQPNNAVIGSWILRE